MIVLFVFFVCDVYLKNYGILLSGSCNFYNYRHTSNVLTLSHVLLKNGFSKDELILLLGENSIEDDRNVDQKHVYLSQNTKIPAPDVDVEESTVRTFLNAVACNHRKLLGCNKSSNVLVYMCGHGNTGFLKIQYRDAIFSCDLNHSIKELACRAKKVLLIVDTCKSESFICNRSFPENVFVATTSSVSEPSVSSFSCPGLGVHCIDNFPYYFYKLANSVSNVGLKEFFDFFGRNQLLSTMKYSYSKSASFYFDDFFRQSHSEESLEPL